SAVRDVDRAGVRVAPDGEVRGAASHREDLRGVLPRHLAAGPAVLAVLCASPAGVGAAPAVLRRPRARAELRRLRRRGGARIDRLGAHGPVRGDQCAEPQPGARDVPHHHPAGLGADDPLPVQSADPAAEGHRDRQLDLLGRPVLPDRPDASGDRNLVRLPLRPAGVLRDRLDLRSGHERPGDPGQAPNRPWPEPDGVDEHAAPLPREQGRKCGHMSAWSWEHAARSLPLLLDGFKITLLATVLGTLIAVVLGLIVAIARRGLPPLFGYPLTGLVEFIRMTPLVVQLVFANLVLSAHFDTLTIGIWVLGVHYMTYMAEVYRAGIDSVPQGQWEAATALSLPQSRTWRSVIIPQAIRNTLPALGNYAISMFKETPFLSFIFIGEMVRQAVSYGGNTFRYTEPLTMAGLIFLAASYPTSVL